ncbi:hypothetical protein ACFQMA_11365 [Halosimplex aquaticum]|uniref:DUF7344 domain-containing protein n=1 Tax=Halosimplex aquaticum TaxID=3026162 RepID=A0ABD5Y4Y2_9EURY|nr:hypothetical protein [Halosimplex aquaticum]
MLGASTVFGLLANDVRRRLLLRLREREPVQVPDAVLERDPDSAESDPVSDGCGGPDHQRLTAVRLHHVHLPKLADAGVVEWHRDRDVVTRGARFGDVEPTLAVLAENAPRLPQNVF